MDLADEVISSLLDEGLCRLISKSSPRAAEAACVNHCGQVRAHPLARSTTRHAPIQREKAVSLIRRVTAVLRRRQRRFLTAPPRRSRIEFRVNSGETLGYDAPKGFRLLRAQAALVLLASPGNYSAFDVDPT